MQTGTEEILAFCRREYAEHGKNGDNTLECIGIVLQNEQLLKMKSYYLDNAKNKPKLLENAVCTDILKKFLKDIEAFFRLWDIAEYKSAEGRLFAMNFLALSNDSEAIKAVADRLTEMNPANAASVAEAQRHIALTADYVSRDRKPLVQIGFQFTPEGEIIAIKYYLLLKKSPSVIPTMDEEMLDLITAINSQADRERLKRFSAVLEDCSYRPVLMGINLWKDGKHEQKIYFDTGKPNFLPGRNLKKASLAAVSATMESKTFNEHFIDELALTGMYIRGFALNAINENEYRIYFDSL